MKMFHSGSECRYGSPSERALRGVDVMMSFINLRSMKGAGIRRLKKIIRLRRKKDGK